MTYLRKRLLRAVAAVVGLVFAAGNAHAILVDQGLNTFDTDTGLLWLDVTETVGDAYSTVLDSSYVMDQGYRFATEAEVTTLYNHAGGNREYYNLDRDPTQYGLPIAEHYDPALMLIDLLSCTSYLTRTACDGSEPGSHQTWHLAMYAPESASSLIPISIVVAHYPGSSYPWTGAIWLDGGISGIDPGARNDIGSYLVKSVVPIPAALLLFGTGIAIMGFVGWRRKRKTASAA